jgi:putative tryptophan/tyrosine transport system substrate-binding protein
MKARIYIQAAAIALIISMAPPAYAQHIWIIKTKNLANYNEVLTGFKVACKMRFTDNDMEGNEDRGHQIATAAKEAKPDAILAVGAQAAIIAKEDIKDIPIIFTSVLNAELYPLKADNVTGILMEPSVDTQLSALRSLIPNIKTIGTVYNPKKTSNLVQSANSWVSKVNLKLISAKVDASSDVPEALRAFSGGIDALWMVPDSTVVTPEGFSTILNYSFQNNIPLFALSQNFVQHGALVSLSPKNPNMGQQACQIIGDVLKNKIPAGNIPFSRPKGLELTFNINTAKKIGLDNIAAAAVTFAASEGYSISVSQ